MGEQTTLDWPPLLRACLSPFLSAEVRAAAFRNLRERTDWEEVCRCLRMQRMTSVAHVELGLREWSSDIPVSVRRTWHYAWRLTRRRAFQRLPVLRTILAAAERAGFPVMVMKGPVFVENLYNGDFGARAFRDIDLVVHAEHVSVLAAMIRRLFPGHARIVFERATSRLHVGIGRTIFEIHWDLSLFYAFNRSSRRARRQEGIWERSREAVFPWGRCRTMADEDSLLHQAEHAVLQHDLNHRPLQEAIDFSRTLLRLPSNISQECLEKLSHEHGCPTAFHAMCVAVSEALDGAQECGLLSAVAATRTRSLRKRAVRQLDRSTRDRVIHGTKDLANMVEAMASFMDGFDNRVRFLRQLIFPSRYALSATFGKTLSRRQYVARLGLHFLLLPFLFPALAILAGRQIADWTTRRRRTTGSRVH